MSKNPLDQYVPTAKQRTVWETKGGSLLLTVTDLLSVGGYEVEKETSGDGIITLMCTPTEEENDGKDA